MTDFDDRLEQMKDVQGLPLPKKYRSDEYKTSQSKNMFTIDMNNSEYDPHLAIVYIRNVRPNAFFDFTNCSTDLKIEYIREYMTTDIEYEIKPIVATIQAILMVYMNNYNGEIPGILNLDEIYLFIEQNKELLNMWASMIVSLPYFLITSFKMDNIDENPIEMDIKLENNDYIFGKNIYFVLHNELLNSLIVPIKEFKQYNFVNLFSDISHKLIRSCENLYATQMLYALSAENVPNFDILKDIEDGTKSE